MILSVITHGKNLNAEAEDDDGLEVTSVTSDKTSEEGHPSTRESGNGSDTRCRKSSLSTGNDEEGVEVGANDATSGRVNQRDEHTADDGAVGHETEGNERMTSSETFPKDEADAANSTNDEKSNAMS